MILPVSVMPQPLRLTASSAKSLGAQARGGRHIGAIVRLNVSGVDNLEGSVEGT